MRILIIFNYKLRFSGVFSRDNLPRTKVASLLHSKYTAVYFDSFGIEYIPQELLNKIKDKSITHDIFRIQSDDSVEYGLYCITFLEYMIAGKTLLDYTNLSFL